MTDWREEGDQAPAWPVVAMVVIVLLAFLVVIQAVGQCEHATCSSPRLPVVAAPERP